MKRPITILLKTRNLWRAFKLIEAFCYGTGLFLFLFWLTNLLIALLAGCLTAGLMLWLLKPWQVSVTHASLLIDRRFENAEYSSGLLLQTPENLSLIARLQQQKIISQLGKFSVARPPHHLIRALSFALLLALTGFLLKNLLPDHEGGHMTNSKAPKAEKSLITATTEEQQLTIESASVHIKPPAYTRLSNKQTAELNIKAIEGSYVSWSLVTNDEVKKIWLEVPGQEPKQLYKQSNVFSISQTLSEDGFYNFKLVNRHGESKTSKLYQLQVIEDQVPTITIHGVDQYTEFAYDDNKKVIFNSMIEDDFGLFDAYIIATVSKGTGESVKFREEKLSFKNGKINENKAITLTKTLDLDEMKMTPGDELYFYVEAIDNKSPRPQATRTETYFLTIQDTTEVEFSLAGSLGVDQMPEYFRSQRQLIIDTEKLIKEKVEMSKKDFNFTSNELGFDQKALRLKYGQFMGVEDESGIAIETNEVEEEVQSTDEDPLADYEHDHDGDNEHNLVADDHDHGEESVEEDDPLEKFMHDHDDPEEATLYTQSTRSMLKQAMAEMWDAELYLRLYQPEKSLPYQYKALKLIKEIKNHARIYVHRIGFDPPPIKEESRLTGELDEVEPTMVNEQSEEEKKFLPLEKAVKRIEQLLHSGDGPDANDRLLFQEAGEAIAPLAVEQPLNYLKTLEHLKQLANNEVGEELMTKVLRQVSVSLVGAIPKETNDPVEQSHHYNELTNRYFRKLKEVVHD